MKNAISLTPSKNRQFRCATRLLTMVHELHKAGYQRIRFSSGMSPSGIHWRCEITYAGNMTPDGLFIQDRYASGEVARYSSSANDSYFDWPDAPGKSARELAVMFLEQFPVIASKGAGRDWAYAGWLTELLEKPSATSHRAFPNSLPTIHSTSTQPTCHPSAKMPDERTQGSQVS